MVVNRFVMIGVMLAASGAGQAHAQSCTNASTAGMTAGQIRTLVSNQYACVGSFPNAQWNELHNSSTGSGAVLDYKKGPTDPVDPSSQTGTFLITAPGGAQSPGVITYTYGSSAYGYYVVNNLTAPVYSFCGQSGGAPQLAVTISASHC